MNLYIPSTLEWSIAGARVQLSQAGEYPFETSVQLELKMSRPAEFALHLRIPPWAQDATVSVNGTRQRLHPVPGTFVHGIRTWRTGDRVELELPMRMRLAQVDPQHPDTVGLLCGPLVLFAIGPTATGITRKHLLAAERVTSGRWKIETGNGSVSMLSFLMIDDEEYLTYLRVT